MMTLIHQTQVTGTQSNGIRITGLKGNFFIVIFFIIDLWRENIMKTLMQKFIIISAIILIPTSWAADLTIPNTFVSGTPAVAAEVNANFTAVKTTVDALSTTVENLSFVPETNSVTTITIEDGAVTNPKLAADSVDSSKITNGSIGNLDISNAAAISASKISGDTGIEFDMIGSCSAIAVSPSVTNCGSISITAPGPGYILLSLTGTAVTFGQGTTARVGIGASISTFEVNSVRIGVLDGTDTLRREFSPSSSGVVEVTQAGTYTYYANAYRPSVFSSTTVNLADLNFTGVFIPKRY